MRRVGLIFKKKGGYNDGDDAQTSLLNRWFCLISQTFEVVMRDLDACLWKALPANMKLLDM